MRKKKNQSKAYNYLWVEYRTLKMAKSFLKKNGISKMSNALLHNKFVLYFIFIVAVGNLFHFVFRQDLSSVGVFIASGLLTSFFSKNMVVIMVVAMVVANVIRLGQGPEGFGTLDEAFNRAIEKAAMKNKDFMEEIGIGKTDDDKNDGDDDDDDDEEDANETDEEDDEEEEEDTDAFRPKNDKNKKESMQTQKKKKGKK